MKLKLQKPKLATQLRQLSRYVAALRKEVDRLDRHLTNIQVDLWEYSETIEAGKK